MDLHALATALLFVVVGILIVEIQRMKRARLVAHRAPTCSAEIAWLLRDSGWTFQDAEREMNRWSGAK